MGTIKHKKPQKVGNSYFFHIPMGHVKHGMVDLKKYYDIDYDDGE